jgi:hypothetical protein
MKKVLYVVIGILIAVVVLSVFKDVLIKASVEKGTEIVTGLRLSIQGFKVGIIKTLVGIRNLKLFNPKGFQDKVMLDMPEIYVNYDLPAIFRGKIHLEEMRIDMKEFMVVKNKKGELNLDSLKVVKAQKEGEKPEEKDKGKVKIPEIQIDSLELKVGKVIYKDYSRGGAPSVKEFNVNINERYENITNPYSLVSLLVVKALMNTTIANLTNFDLQGLSGTVSETLASAQKLATEAVVQAGETIKQTTKVAQEAVQGTQKAAQATVGEAEEAVKETAGTLKKTTEGLTDMLKMPFGSKEE